MSLYRHSMTDVMRHLRGVVELQYYECTFISGGERSKIYVHNLHRIYGQCN